MPQVPNFNARITMPQTPQASSHIGSHYNNPHSFYFCGIQMNLHVEGATGQLPSYCIHASGRRVFRDFANWFFMLLFIN
jgi:hypothetical protein